MNHTYPYPLPAVTVDMVIFRSSPSDGELEVLLIKRRDDPFKGQWALPGGFVEVGVGHKPEGDQGESLEDAAARELKEETGLGVVSHGIFLEQIGVFGDPGRDPRGRVISVAYMTLLDSNAAEQVQVGDDAIAHQWVYADLGTIQDMAFDHKKILAQGLKQFGKCSA